MLACVLGRFAPGSLATARCVCKAWRDTIDARRILRADLLPLSLAGIFINFNELWFSEFFSRPPRPEGLVGNRESRPVQCAMEDHCNGLVLHDNRVANPATGWTAPLPPPPPPKGAGMECFVDEAYLVYDPTVSAHYQVVLIPCVPYIELHIEPGEEIDFDVDPAVLESEWPPSSCVQRVFSSSTKRWEERTFFRDGEAAGTVAYLGTDCSWNKRHAVYWHDALYVHCQKGFVMRYVATGHFLSIIIIILSFSFLFLSADTLVND
uniref:F-box domain-containing protein n=1 Tax=Triticum urartu TaxID=4572 RepID=A0A8R7UZX8_TRIUA